MTTEPENTVDEEIDVFADSENRLVAKIDLGTLSEYAKEMVRLEAEVAELEAKKVEKNKRIWLLSTMLIPDALSEVGMASFKLDTGQSVTTEDHVHASIKEDHAAEAFKWLRDNNHGSLIKNRITVDLDKKEDHIATKIKEFLRSIGQDAEIKESVHWKTLTSFVKEQVKRGSPLPLEILGATVGKRTKIVM